VADRTWGYWTEAKLDILAEYLPCFTKASRKSPAIIYLDLFSGEPDNLARETGKRIDGSARLALDCSPPFTTVCLFELEKPAQKLDQSLRSAYPDRDLRIYAGDCNETIEQALLNLKEVCWAPTFAFIDPYVAQIHWQTLETISKHKKPGKPKVEIWLLFAHAQFPRGLGVEEGVTYETFAPKTTKFFGTEDWKQIHEARKVNQISPEEFRDELVNLMRWRLEKQLGYKWTHTLELKNTQGTPIYSMIFATDHKVGDKIMSHIYAKAADRHPQMRADAAADRQRKREEEEGTPGLFPPISKPKDSIAYKHSPPEPPYSFTRQR
jgi:three-Cys-motif partner protein